MNQSSLTVEKAHLAELLAAIQRCVYFLHASSQKLSWPLTVDYLIVNKKDIDLFEAMAAINQRFAKLQDTLAAAMRHASLLSAETNDSFLKILSFYEKLGIIDSVESWQLCRTARNLAAHDYEINYDAIAEHFNTLYELTPTLYQSAKRFQSYCQQSLAIEAIDKDFYPDFQKITQSS